MKLLKISYIINVTIIFGLTFSCNSKEKTECDVENLDFTYLFFESGFSNDNVKVLYEDKTIFEDDISTIESIDLAAEIKIDINKDSEFSIFINEELIGTYCLKKFIEIDNTKYGIDLKSVDNPKKYQ